MKKVIREKSKSLWADFKKFAVKGNVIDMAVGVVVGTAFTAIVNALVNNIIMPLFSLLNPSNLDIASMGIPLGKGEEAAVLGYGAFIAAVINFLLIALVLFLAIRLISKLNIRRRPPPPAAKSVRLCPYCFQPIDDRATRCHHCTSVLEAAPTEQ